MEERCAVDTTEYLGAPSNVAYFSSPWNGEFVLGPPGALCHGPSLSAPHSGPTVPKRVRHTPQVSTQSSFCEYVPLSETGSVPDSESSRFNYDAVLRMKQLKLADSSLGSGRPRMRCRVSLRHTRGPLDGFKIHLANIRILPRLSRMSTAPAQKIGLNTASSTGAVPIGT